MTLEELKKLIADDEGETVEVKETTGQRRNACETLCAFLNKDGGTVVFGVTKKGKLTGQLMADTTKRDLFEMFKKFEPAADIEVSYVPVDETHTAIVCHVDGGNRKPYIYDGKPHKRVQSSTTVMSQEEIPADALREALVNAFAHRSYENRSQTIYLAIYDDRVEIKNPGKFPSDFNLARLYSPPIQHSEPRNEKIARVLYLRKSIETWGRGLTRIANECARVGLPVPEVKEEYGCITTTFRRPDWTGANTPDQRTGTGVATTGTTSAISGTIVATTGTGATRTGTGRGLSGTGWTIIGMTAPDNVGELLARLPKLRKDARANVESVLHELVTDKNATIPQICARTGMALRTINNALATLRAAKIVLPREVTEKSNEGTKKQPIGAKKQPIDSEKPSISPEKPSISPEKPSIGDEKLHIDTEKLHIGEEELHIESALTELDITQPTKQNILKLFQRFGTADIFGRSDVCKITGLQERAASYLIGAMLRNRLLDTVKGHGKGKYRFRSKM